MEFAVDGTSTVSEVVGNYYEKNAVAVAGGIGTLAESGVPVVVVVVVPGHEVGCPTPGPSDGKYTRHAALGKGREIAETLRAPAWELEWVISPLDGLVRTNLGAVT